MSKLRAGGTFDNGVLGTAFNLEETVLGVIKWGDYSEIQGRQHGFGHGRIASVPVGGCRWLVRVVNALGQP